MRQASRFIVANCAGYIVKWALQNISLPATAVRGTRNMLSASDIILYPITNYYIIQLLYYLITITRVLKTPETKFARGNRRLRIRAQQHAFCAAILTTDLCVECDSDHGLVRGMRF